jgi:hypothetical protein
VRKILKRKESRASQVVYLLVRAPKKIPKKGFSALGLSDLVGWQPSVAMSLLQPLQRVLQRVLRLVGSLLALHKELEVVHDASERRMLHALGLPHEPQVLYMLDEA